MGLVYKCQKLIFSALYLIINKVIAIIIIILYLLFPRFPSEPFHF